MSPEDTEIMHVKAKELEDKFSYEYYEVARNELFANLRIPSVTIRKDSITFSKSCINQLEDTVYIEILVDKTHRRIAVRQCDENDKDAQRWCIAKDGKRKSRKMTSREFSARIYEMMGWDKSCRYKVIGYKIHHQGDTLIVFVLDEHSTYKERKRKTKEQVFAEAENSELSAEQLWEREQEAQRMARKPFYPDDWVNSFGVPVKDHHNVELESIDDYDQMDTMYKKE